MWPSGGGARETQMFNAEHEGNQEQAILRVIESLRFLTA